MKFIHTSDWHLGKKLHEHSLLDDQVYILDQFLKIVDDEKPDAIVIAGDIYDSRIPPSDAVDLFNEVLNKILLEKNVPILCIAGNHDSSSRLNFGSKLFEKNNFFMRANLEINSEPIIFDDDFGKIYFSLMPYFYPAKVREVFSLPTQESISYDDAARIIIDNERLKIPAGQRSIAVAHLFIINSDRSESEEEKVGGIDAINPEHFADYNYVVLGHLHKPQSKYADKVRYSGSPLKYSFSEENHHKGVDIVNIDGSGNVKFKQIPLTPKRDVRIISGFLADILKEAKPTEDYILVRLKDEQPYNAGERLRQKGTLYKNLLGVENISDKSTQESIALQERDNLNDVELFSLFFKEMNNRPMNEAEQSAFMECVESLNKME